MKEAEDQDAGSLTFSGVEELEDAARELGWNIAYRQLCKGRFSAELTCVEGGGLSLATEHYNTHVQVQAEPPEGFVGFFWPRYPAGDGTAFGQVVAEAELIAFPSHSEIEFVTRGRVRDETMFLREDAFRAAARSLAPSAALLSSSSAVIHAADPGRFASIQRLMASAHRNGGLDHETASELLASTILWMEDASPACSAERLANGVAAAVASRARTFIEENFHGAIRLEHLCHAAGVGLRTLQRAFASQYQLCPSQYIKARRLNAARRDLVAAEPSSRSVTRIGTNCGFSNLGRFSVEYRAHFGESPSETLRHHGP